MLSQLGQHNVVHHGKVGINKSTEVVNNYHVQRYGILELILGRELLYNILGQHFEDKVNLSDSPLRCLSGSLKKLLKDTTLQLPLSVIIHNCPCNLWGRAYRRVTSTPSTSIGNQRDSEALIWRGNTGSLRRCKTIRVSMWRLVPLSDQQISQEALNHPAHMAS